MDVRGPQQKWPPRLRRAVPPLCPVTALAFFRTRQPSAGAAAPASVFLLAGEDGWLCVYGVGGEEEEERGGRAAGAEAAAAMPEAVSPTLGRCCGRLRVFSEQAIQGCRVGRGGDDDVDDGDEDGDGDILVWGGRSVALVRRQQVEKLLADAEGEDEQDDGDKGSSAAVCQEIRAPDWIYDGLLPRARASGSGSGRSDLGAFITAHNEVLPFTVAETAEGSAALVLGAAISPSRPGLYAAQLAWAEGREGRQSGSRLVVAAGTAFGEIVVWTCQLAASCNINHINSSSSSSSVQVLDVFAGHEGSIFGVALSPALGLLVSCSDDRTIRAWPLRRGGEDGSSSSRSRSGHVLAEVRETGFQNTFESVADGSSKDKDKTKGQKQSSGELAVVMAHASRIWRVRFGPTPRHGRDGRSSRSICLFSFGEDAAAQEWRLKLGPSSSSGCFQHVRTLSGHSGKNIWASAVLLPRPADGRPPLVATGAADGKICLFAGADSAFEANSPGAAADGRGYVPDPLVSAPASLLPSGGPPQSRQRDEVFNNCAFLSGHQILAATSHGRLFLGRIQVAASAFAPTTTAWTQVDIDPATAAALRRYNVVRAAPPAQGLALALVGGAGGRLFLYLGSSFSSSSAAGTDSGKLHPLETAVPGKVEDIFFLPGVAAADSGTARLQVVVAVLGRDPILVDLAVSSAAGGDSGGGGRLLLSERCQQLRLPVSLSSSDHVIVTAASRCRGHVILGTRKGQLLLYRRGAVKDADDGGDGGDDGDGATLAAETQTATCDAILAVVPLPPLSGQPPRSCSAFVVTARDGTYRIYAIEEEKAKGGKRAPALRFHLCHETALPFGPIIRDAWFVSGGSGPGSDGPELVLCGFRSSRFVVWNETRQQELAAVECAGTHRTYAYLVGGSSGSDVRLAFTRGGRLHVFAQASSPLAAVRSGGHGRETKAVASSASGAYVATGSEDTVVRLWAGKSFALSSSSARPSCLAVLKRHNTGLHGLTWLGDDCLVSAGGAEELFVWRIARIPDSSYDGLAVLCASAYPDRAGDDKTLRVTAVDVSLEGGDDANREAPILITMALSNSVLKTYRYSPADDRWQLLAQGRYTGACPTHVRHLRHRHRHRHQAALGILAAFADGHLSVWRADTAEATAAAASSPQTQHAPYVLLRTMQVHRCAIKSLDLWRRPDGGTDGQTAAAVIVTGGDDNAIAVTPLDCAFAFGTACRVSSAHAAAVTGLCIVDASWHFCQTDHDAVQANSDAHQGDTTTATHVRLMAVSCSNDQRVKAWAVRVALQGHPRRPVHVQLLDSRCSAVADAADMEKLHGQSGEGTSIMVTGMGMETWRLGATTGLVES